MYLTIRLFLLIVALIPTQSNDSADRIASLEFAQLNLTNQLKMMVNEMKDVKSALFALGQFPLPPYMAKLSGTRVRDNRERDLGHLSLPSLNGSWFFKSSERLSQEEADKEWSYTMKGGGRLNGAVLVIPIKPYLMVQFALYGAYAAKNFSIDIVGLKTRYNYKFSNLFPFKYEVKVRIQSNGFTEMQHCSFIIPSFGVYPVGKPKIPINKNWDQNKLPKDIEFIFL